MKDIFKFSIKFLFGIISIILHWVKNNFDRGSYEVVYFSTFFIIMVPSVVWFKGGWPDIYSFIALSVIVAISVFSFYHIQARKSNNLSNYFKCMAKLSFYLWILGVFVTTMISPKITIYLYILTLTSTFYYIARYFVEKTLDHWFKYFILFMCVPVISLFVSDIYMLLIAEEFSFLPSDSILLKMTVLISIVIQNIIILFTRNQRIVEVKVATYLMLALFSTLSYCFFMSDLIVSLFNPQTINNFGGIEKVKQDVQELFSWILFPYLVGTVWACFIIEWIERNTKKQD
ncbi:hypothetical protein [Brevibacillus sp. SYSU BS000544]|uniref:hypothetical protein n=1 Tax=Brevibacillus sp. SYSU BS000544 TaxID=3416443 RepID=UPI003CE486E7